MELHSNREENQYNAMGVTCFEETLSKIRRESDRGAILEKVIKEDLFEELKFEQRIEQSKGTSHADLEKVDSMWRDWKRQRP